MASATPRLKNTLSFTALAPAASAVLVHNLNDGAKALAPDIIYIPDERLTVTASGDASVTIRNDGAAALSGVVLVEAWHTVERAFGDKANVDLTTKPYIVVGDGGSAHNPMALPEQWIVQNAEASGGAAMSAQVSANFGQIQAIRAGSIVGVRARTPAALNGGTAAVTPTINGAPVAGLTATLTNGTSGVSATAAIGAVPYVAGDRIGAAYVTNGDFSPTQDIEAWLEVHEAL